MYQTFPRSWREKEETLDDLPGKDEKGHRPSDQHLNRDEESIRGKGEVGVGGSGDLQKDGGMERIWAFPENIDTILN